MELDVLATGLCFGEGPRWHHGRLWFSDMHDHRVDAVGLDGRLEVMVDTPGPCSGLGWLPSGELLVVAMVERQLLRLDHDRLVVHADLGAVAAWHANDMVVDDAGRAYVGNFGFDLHEAERTGDFSGRRTAALALVDPDGSVRPVADDLRFPNGTVITPDGRTLIVAETMGRRLTAFERADDGSLGDRRVWAELGHRLPDGICLDADGCIWFADAGAAECVRVAEGGRVVEVVPTDATAYACMLGGPEGRHLFVLTARSSRPEQCREERAGHVLVGEVSVPHAGRP